MPGINDYNMIKFYIITNDGYKNTPQLLIVAKTKRMK